ncbi:MAG: hypothetical protein PHV61_09900 [Limnochordia bacterium]|nr:hypothetical protein [Limnochordia bacterium]MDD4517786.1 hypothetical protein [Limnochordia bacterium]
MEFPVKVMLDSNAFDLVAADDVLPHFLPIIRQGYLRFLSTPIQEGEIAAISDGRKRSQLQTVPRLVVATPEASTAMPDEIILHTAQEYADILVTEDKFLTERCEQNASCRVMNFKHLLGLMIELRTHIGKG